MDSEMQFEFVAWTLLWGWMGLMFWVTFFFGKFLFLFVCSFLVLLWLMGILVP